MRAQKVVAKVQPRLIDITPANFDSFPCCGIKSQTHPGRQAKRLWLESNAKFGIRAKALMAPDGEACGYIEYVPGEFAWRGVNAAGYFLIHCLWMHYSRYQGKGWGGLMLKACLDEGEAAGMDGVAVMVRKGPWMADHRLFLAHGFILVDSAPPDYQLLARKFNKDAQDPAFNDSNRQSTPYPNGLTIAYSSQCPYTAKFASEITDCAKTEYGIEPKIVELRSYSEAQNAPTPYATFALIYDGNVVADHQISRTRFRNIMRHLPPADGRSCPSAAARVTDDPGGRKGYRES